MRLRIFAGAPLLLAALAGPTQVAAAGTVAVPLDPYPVSAPSPLGNSIPPEFLDEDETVRARVDPTGRVVSMVDDALIKIRGAGDYVIQLPARVTQVADLGGDSVPGLQDGHVSFLGHAVGAQRLGVEATLDRAQAATLPVSVDLAYSVAGKPLAPADLGHTAGPVTVTLAIRNLTARPHPFVRASATPAPLAQALEALRHAGDLYIPEINLGDQLPVPPVLPASAPAAATSADTYVPLTTTTVVKLPPRLSATAVSPPADVTTDSRGTSLRWVRQLPAGTDGPGLDTLTFTIGGRHPSLPGVDVRADPLPLPAAYFTPPGGGAWAAYLAGRRDRTAETLLAQQGMASLHRIGELAQPLGRPGPGPVKVRYDFILDSGVVAPRPVAVPPPVHPQPVVVFLVLVLGAGSMAWLARAWARN